jgi:hypothetical protein
LGGHSHTPTLTQEQAEAANTDGIWCKNAAEQGRQPMHRVWELCNACKAKPTGTSSEVQVTPAPLCKCRCAPPPPQGWAGCGWHGARPRPRGICLCPGLAQMWSHGYPVLTPFWCMHCTAWFQNRVCRLWSRIWTAGPANSGLKTAAPPPLPKPNPPGVGYPAPRPPLSGAPIRFRFGGVNAKLCPTKVGGCEHIGELLPHPHRGFSGPGCGCEIPIPYAFEACWDGAWLQVWDGTGCKAEMAPHASTDPWVAVGTRRQLTWCCSQSCGGRFRLYQGDINTILVL